MIKNNLLTFGFLGAVGALVYYTNKTSSGPTGFLENVGIAFTPPARLTPGAMERGRMHVENGLARIDTDGSLIITPAGEEHITRGQNRLLSQANYISLGYAYIDDEGSFKITPEGEEYINRNVGNQ